MAHSTFSLFLIRNYGYVEARFMDCLNLLPPFLRAPIYKLIFANYGSGVYIGENCYFRYPWRIWIGDNVKIGPGCEFYPSIQKSNSSIRIEANAVIGPNVHFYGAGHPAGTPNSADVWGEILICESAYVGADSRIRYGVRVGRKSTIGLGSIIVKSVSDSVTVIGNSVTEVN